MYASILILSPVFNRTCLLIHQYEQRLAVVYTMKICHVFDHVDRFFISDNQLPTLFHGHQSFPYWSTITEDECPPYWSTITEDECPPYWSTITDDECPPYWSPITDDECPTYWSTITDDECPPLLVYYH